GVHPAVLTEEGLGGALESLASRTPVPVKIDRAPEDRLPTEIEAAAYFVACEAIANAVKHARATQIRVCAERRNGSLVIEGDADGLRRAVATQKPDVAIVDVRMPPTQTDEGARAAETIRERHPEVGVLMLSQIVEATTALKLFGERPEGFGYLLKDRVLEIDDFVEAVKRVARGGTAMDPQIVSQLFGNRRRDDPVDELSPREREVLGLM